MYFWDSCNIQTFHLGRYIVEYTVGNLVVRGRESGTVKCDSDGIFEDLLLQMKILNMFIPVLIHFCSFI